MAKQDKGNLCQCCGQRKPNRRRRFLPGHPLPNPTATGKNGIGFPKVPGGITIVYPRMNAAGDMVTPKQPAVRQPKPKPPARQPAPWQQKLARATGGQRV